MVYEGGRINLRSGGWSTREYRGDVEKIKEVVKGRGVVVMNHEGVTVV